MSYMMKTFTIGHRQPLDYLTKQGQCTIDTNATYDYSLFWLSPACYSLNR